jgi:hypothetical protein
MTTAEIKDPMMLKPTLTADGKPWVQRCFICGRTVNFIKEMPSTRVRIGELVRHAKCDPEPLR